MAKEPADKRQVVTFQRLYPSAPLIRPAEKSAAGAMHMAAYQYCEAMRTASAFGFYVYPPRDIHLLYDGKESFFYDDGQWFPVKSIHFEDEFRESWAEHAPPHLTDRDPPFVSELFIPGMIQIWTGYLVRSAPGWAISLKPPVNYNVRSSYSVYEGIVETDVFGPMPLFINIQLLATGREIFIPSGKPLFQVQQVLRETYAPEANKLDLIDGFQNVDWEDFSSTIRNATPEPDYVPGRYAARSRKDKRASD